MNNMEENKAEIYQTELFDKLRKSMNLKREEDCIGCLIKPALWWMIERPDPRSIDIEKLVGAGCPCLKNKKRKTAGSCTHIIMDSISRASQTRKLSKFNCIDGLHGFVYPITQGDKLYGYIGTCYTKNDVSSDILDVFSAFTDTVVREVQKELELSKLYETLRPRAIALSTVHTVHRLISSTLDLAELLPRIARLSLQILRANRCSIKLVD